MPLCRYFTAVLKCKADIIPGVDRYEVNQSAPKVHIEFLYQAVLCRQGFQEGFYFCLSSLLVGDGCAVRELFGLWQGLGVINRVSTAIGTQPDDAEEVKLSEMIDRSFDEDKFTTCPLFEGVQLGGLSGDESSTADLVADLLKALQNLPRKADK